MTAVPIVALVHGAFADGSGWQGVYELPARNGVNVRVAQIQTLSLESDVETIRNVLDDLGGPAILVGHSYGGVVITEAGDDDRVAGLVYVAAFVPDAGESVGTLIANPPAGAPVLPILPPQNGFLGLDRAQFAAAWRTKPSWYLVATDDRIIPPAARREMAARADSSVAQAAASHAIYASQPAAVADVIKRAAIPAS